MYNRAYFISQGEFSLFFSLRRLHTIKIHEYLVVNLTLINIFHALKYAKVALLVVTSVQLA